MPYIEENSINEVAGHIEDGVLSVEDKNRLAEENINVVYHVAKGFSNTGMDSEELISIGLLGYAKALDSYRNNRNTKFSTYAINCIRNEILYILKKEKKHRMHNVSLNKVLSTDKNGNDLQLEEILLNIGDSDQGGLESELLDNEKKERIKDVVENQLNDRERYVICHRYELFGMELKTQSQIAEEMQMSQANVSKIEKNVLKKMSKYIDRSELLG